jgi:hypothetical protein
MVGFLKNGNEPSDSIKHSGMDYLRLYIPSFTSCKRKFLATSDFHNAIYKCHVNKIHKC